MSSRAPGGMGRGPALVFARRGVPVADCDRSAAAAQATVELGRGADGAMVSKQLRRLTKPAGGQVPGRPGARPFGRAGARCNLAAPAYLSRLGDICGEERDRGPATRLASSGGVKAW